MDSRETDAVIRNLSAFAFFRQSDLKTEAMAVSCKISQNLSISQTIFVSFIVMSCYHYDVLFESKCARSNTGVPEFNFVSCVGRVFRSIGERTPR